MTGDKAGDAAQQKQTISIHIAFFEQ